MTPETFRAKAHSWLTGRPFVDAERGVLVVPGPRKATIAARWQVSSDGETWRDIGPRRRTARGHEPAWLTAFRDIPVREFGLSPEEEAEANQRATLRSVLPEDFETE